ncbi:hypothetical protein DERF_001460 [Dermatophagoides farinae]|uniref:Uncharacterized protein n=1 Tax=Dermatophagoides farinae TaxID=6954 RepID=A0A922IF14_DERFA|nr:hypothetical protein DERF_001460 [Dermatophagoides farinae]
MAYGYCCFFILFFFGLMSDQTLNIKRVACFVYTLVKIVITMVLGPGGGYFGPPFFAGNRYYG